MLPGCSLGSPAQTRRSSFRGLRRPETDPGTVCASRGVWEGSILKFPRAQKQHGNGGVGVGPVVRGEAAGGEREASGKRSGR